MSFERESARVGSWLQSATDRRAPKELQHHRNRASTERRPCVKLVSYSFSTGRQERLAWLDPLDIASRTATDFQPLRVTQEGDSWELGVRSGLLKPQECQELARLKLEVIAGSIKDTVGSLAQSSRRPLGAELLVGLPDRERDLLRSDNEYVAQRKPGPSLKLTSRSEL